MAIKWFHEVACTPSVLAASESSVAVFTRRPLRAKTRIFSSPTVTLETGRAPCLRIEGEGARPVRWGRGLPAAELEWLRDVLSAYLAMRRAGAAEPS